MLLSSGNIRITECEDSLFEKNLLDIQRKSQKKEITKKPEEKIEITNNIEVKIRGHFYEAGGYAKVNRNLAIGLNNNGINVNIEAVNKTNEINEYEVRQLAKINKSVGNKAIVIDSMIPTFSNMFGGGSYRILYTTVEAGSVPQQFIDAANNYNEIWVTSDFCKKVLVKQGLKKNILVFPDSIDLNLYNENCETYEFKPKLKDFVFLSVFGWSYRKGYDVLLKAYLDEFSDNDPVSLLIVSRYICDSVKTDTVRDTIKQYLNASKKNAPHIAKSGMVIPEEQMPGLYKSAKAYVSFSRGEGFGITFCEASLCGLPVISTNISGHTMFLKKDNSYLLDVDKISPISSGKMHVHYWDNQLFPELTDENTIMKASQLMREVFENYREAKEKNNKLQKFIKENYDINVASKNVVNRLKEIWENIK